ncbi:hypothetical protein EMIHUDRAFT_443411, partial [Emiliania huxleyi CCMP1516]|uniref:Alpha-type protein kinase domain-containing protein n=2 Tax=Emiliania huxleyi TaxID=2903 RepID=A0A0D3I7L7_EMIH1
MPALDKLLQLVAAFDVLLNPVISQTCVYWLSDGRPSDPTVRGVGDTAALAPLVASRMAELIDASRSPVSMSCIGLGSDEDFAVLHEMADCVPGGRGSFHALSQLNEAAITATLTTFSSSLLTSRLASIRVDDHIKRRERPVTVRIGLAVENATFQLFPAAKVFFPPDAGDFDSPMTELGSYAIEVSTDALAKGGERNVFHMRFCEPAPDFSHAKDRWVVKENRRVEESTQRELEFHRTSLVTQKTAEALAERFNERAVELGLEGLPRIAFMTCCFVTVQRETG